MSGCWLFLGSPYSFQETCSAVSGDCPTGYTYINGNAASSCAAATCDTGGAGGKLQNADLATCCQARAVCFFLVVLSGCWESV